jgi:hypothetical protein
MNLPVSEPAAGCVLALTTTLREGPGRREGLKVTVRDLAEDDGVVTSPRGPRPADLAEHPTAGALPLVAAARALACRSRGPHWPHGHLAVRAHRGRLRLVPYHEAGGTPLGAGRRR